MSKSSDGFEYCHDGNPEELEKIIENGLAGLEKAIKELEKELKIYEEKTTKQKTAKTEETDDASE